MPGAKMTNEYQRAWKRRRVQQAGVKPCECGCGTEIPALRSDARTPRKYAQGHEPHPKRGRRVYACPECGDPCSRGARRCRRCADRRLGDSRRIVVPARTCEVCGTMFGRRVSPSGKKETAAAFMARRTCSPECARRLPRHRANGTSNAALCRHARLHLKDACERCGTTEALQAHHRDRDRSNNDAANIVTFCFPCHLAYHREHG